MNQQNPFVMKKLIVFCILVFGFTLSAQPHDPYDDYDYEHNRYPEPPLDDRWMDVYDEPESNCDHANDYDDTYHACNATCDHKKYGDRRNRGHRELKLAIRDYRRMKHFALRDGYISYREARMLQGMKRRIFYLSERGRGQYRVH